ncbi:MAG TPA: DUF418 domain-containing protein [Allosphingosinicella sp.]|jgi:uncharacterized protein|uniref:DUF418 domain-containing protein n=1 Tax=Allosphingosinicella sp. TaxID=2823234 RepID=UPI002F2757C7
MDKPVELKAVAAAERVAMLDALRGFALFGILLANLMGFVVGPAPVSMRTVHVGAALAGPVEFALEWLVVGKFYSLFSLLFGIGFAIQLQRLEVRGEGTGRYVRRLVVLFGFGLAHMLLLWIGDILSLYALVGLALLLFRGASDRTLLVCAALLWLLPILWQATMSYAGFAPQQPLIDAAIWTFTQFGIDARQGPFPIWTSPDYLIHLRSHPGEILVRYHDFVEQLRPAKVLAMFLLGLWAGRRRIFADPGAHLPLLRRIAIGGFLLGLPLAFARAWLGAADGGSSARQLLEEVAYCVGTPVLALAYAAAFALLWSRSSGGRLTNFAPAGQMALTNYLAQTVLMCLLFFGWGFALMGRLHLGFLPLVAIAIFRLQLACSRWWLGRYRFGPLEWLWRTLTYGKAQPMRLPGPQWRSANAV